MIRLVYNLLITLLTPIAVPCWVVHSLAKGHGWSSLGEALGGLRVPSCTTVRDPIWFHAVSVGELQASLPLLRRMRTVQPRVPIVVSTGTATGRRLAAGKLNGIADLVFRGPLDLPWCVSRVFRKLQPRLLVVAETELWPNYFFQARRHGIPALIVNGRISDRAAPAYRRFRFLFKPVLDCARLVLAQSETDRSRFIATGASPGRTRVGGNLKYDVETDANHADLAPDLRAALDRIKPDLLFIAGSTREGEEQLLVPTLQALLETAPNWLAIVAPRHPRRFDEAVGILRAAGLPVYRRSRLGEIRGAHRAAVLVLDSLGELAGLYRRADLVFVGGSLNGWGGHNVLEAVMHAKAVVVGPYMQNFRGIAADLLDADGLVQVPDADALRKTILSLAADSSRRHRIGRAGREFAQLQRGAAERAVREVSRLYRSALPTAVPALPARVGLALPSAVWGAVAEVRRWAYGSGLLPARRLNVPVLSVGNLTAGGTGKTPMVAWLVERLAERGHPSAVLTRGYGRAERAKPQLARAGEEADPRLYGDEPTMLLRRFAASAPDTLVAVSADRHAAGQTVAERGEPAFLVLDDGFQHMQLQRSLDIVLLDSRRPFGNGHTLPLGRLREPVASLRDADIVILTRSAAWLDPAPVHDVVRAINPEVKIFRSRNVARDLAEVGTGIAHKLDHLDGKRVAAFCGIGNPASFFRQVHDLDLRPVLERTYRDHHRYSQRDLARLSQAAAAVGAEAFLTTAKDAINLGEAALAIPTYVLRIGLEIDAEAELLECVLALRKG